MEDQTRRESLLGPQQLWKLGAVLFQGAPVPRLPTDFPVDLYHRFQQGAAPSPGRCSEKRGDGGRRSLLPFGLKAVGDLIHACQQRFPVGARRCFTEFAHAVTPHWLRPCPATWPESGPSSVRPCERHRG